MKNGKNDITIYYKNTDYNIYNKTNKTYYNRTKNTFNNNNKNKNNNRDLFLRTYLHPTLKRSVSAKKKLLPSSRTGYRRRVYRTGNIGYTVEQQVQ